jgi:hypothetical protein
MTFIPVMWLQTDIIKVLLYIVLPINVVLSLVLSITDKLFFVEISPLNIAYLMIGGWPTTLIWIIVGSCGKWLFGESDFGRFHYEGIFYQLAPFGKTFQDMSSVQDFNSFEMVSKTTTTRHPMLLLQSVVKYTLLCNK